MISPEIIQKRMPYAKRPNGNIVYRLVKWGRSQCRAHGVPYSLITTKLIPATDAEYMAYKSGKA